MPHAMQVRQPGGPKVLNWTEVAVGEPGSGQVRLRQAAAGLNYTAPDTTPAASFLTGLTQHACQQRLHD
jgi:hypothetical protein